MDWHIILQFISAGFLIPLMRWVWKIKSNEIEHLQSGINEIKEVVSDTNAKLIKHIEWHLDRRSNGDA